MRTGEVFALTWNDIDLKNKVINVNKTVYSKMKDDKGRWYLGTTKTDGSCREVYINETLYKALYNYKNKQNLLRKELGSRYKKYYLEATKNKYGKIIEYKIIESKYKRKDNIDIVFTRKDGTYSGTDITKYPFKIIHNELRIVNCRFYDLRGDYATKILRNGAEIKDIANILGHNSIETTENYYILSSKEAQKEANSIMECVIKSDVISKIINYK